MFRSCLFAVFLFAPAHSLAQSAAARADPPLARASFSNTMDGAFRQIDADKDGQLTGVEIEKFQRAAAIAQVQARSRALFAQLDTDRNGQLTPAEFAKVPLTAPASVASGLLKFDTNKDGRVSLLEHRTATLANFDRLDTDKDGFVSEIEKKQGRIGR